MTQTRLIQARLARIEEVLKELNDGGNAAVFFIKTEEGNLAQYRDGMLQIEQEAQRERQAAGPFRFVSYFADLLRNDSRLTSWLSCKHLLIVVRLSILIVCWIANDCVPSTTVV